MVYFPRLVGILWQGVWGSDGCRPASLHFLLFSSCGEVVKKALSQRTHRCPECGLVLDRDWNAAINILELALRTVGHTGTLNASGDIDLCLGEEIPSSKPSRGKRKPKE